MRGAVQDALALEVLLPGVDQRPGVHRQRATGVHADDQAGLVGDPLPAVDLDAEVVLVQQVDERLLELQQRLVRRAAAPSPRPRARRSAAGGGSGPARRHCRARCLPSSRCSTAAYAAGHDQCATVRQSAGRPGADPRAAPPASADLLVDPRVVEQVEVVHPAEPVHVVGREREPVVVARVARARCAAAPAGRRAGPQPGPPGCGSGSRGRRSAGRRRAGARGCAQPGRARRGRGRSSRPRPACRGGGP